MRGNIFIVSLLACNVVCSQANRIYKIAKEVNSSNALLWMVSGKDIRYPSYVFGTMHNLCDSDRTLSKKLVKIISTCDIIYFEVNLGDDKQRNLVDWYMKNNQTLSSLIPDSDYKIIINYFRVHNYPLTEEQINKMQPIFLSMALDKLNLPCKNLIAAEQMILMQGKTLNKVFKGLESSKEQSAIIANFPYKWQAQELEKYVHHLDENRDRSLAGKVFYFAQDLGALDSMINDGRMTKKDYKIMVLYRNKKWLPIIRKAASQNPTFIAVGTAHLLGDDGILAMLRRQGYVVTAVHINPFAQQ